MPAVITLDDLATMIAADTHGRRYETKAQVALAKLLQGTPAEHLEVKPTAVR